MKQYKNIFIVTLFLVVSVFIGASLFYPANQTASSLNSNSEAVKDKAATVYIEDTLTETKAPIADNTSVLDILTTLHKENTFVLKKEKYKGLGTLVTAIGHHANGENNEFWHYYVNGKQPLASPDAYILKDGDRVEWRFAPLQF